MSIPPTTKVFSWTEERSRRASRCPNSCDIVWLQGRPLYGKDIGPGEMLVICQNCYWALERLEAENKKLGKT